MNTEPVQVPHLSKATPNALQQVNRSIYRGLRAFCRWWLAPWDAEAAEKVRDAKDLYKLHMTTNCYERHMAWPRYVIFIPVLGQMWLLMTLFGYFSFALVVAIISPYYLGKLCFKHLGRLGPATKRFLLGPGEID